MVNRNNGRFIGEAIASVMAQDYGRWELVVVENASTDNSRDILRPWMRQESRIRLISLTCPVAIPAARNVGLARARGEYIATIDSDDVWLPDRLSRQLELMERPGHEQVGVCGSNVWLIDELGRTTGIKQFPDNHERCLKALWHRNPHCHSATLIRRSALARCGAYDDTFAPVEDLELWFRIGRRFELMNLGDYLVKYRIWQGNVTSQRHRLMVRQTVRARRLAVKRYGYRMRMRGRAALVVTWLAQWLPAGLARAIFERWVLRRSSGSGAAVDRAEVLNAPKRLRARFTKDAVPEAGAPITHE
jgi:glycosyltransferase involved in cell wall biosynthesis